MAQRPVTIDDAVLAAAATLPMVAEQAIRWYPATWSLRVPVLKEEFGAVAERCDTDHLKRNALSVTRRVVFDVFADAATMTTLAEIPQGCSAKFPTRVVSNFRRRLLV